MFADGYSIACCARRNLEHERRWACAHSDEGRPTISVLPHIHPTDARAASDCTGTLAPGLPIAQGPWQVGLRSDPTDSWRPQIRA